MGVLAFRWFVTLKTQVQCRRVGDCLHVVADVKHISRLDQRASRSRLDSSHHDHLPLESSGFCDVSRADPNSEELGQSTVIAFLVAITLTA